MSFVQALPQFLNWWNWLKLKSLETAHSPYPSTIHSHLFKLPLMTGTLKKKKLAHLLLIFHSEWWMCQQYINIPTGFCPPPVTPTDGSSILRVHAINLTVDFLFQFLHFCSGNPRLKVFKISFQNKQIKINWWWWYYRWGNIYLHFNVLFW